MVEATGLQREAEAEEHDSRTSLSGSFAPEMVAYGSDAGVEERERLSRVMTLQSTGEARAALDPGMAQKVESLARTLSQHTARDGRLVVDPDDFDMKAILSGLVSASRKQDIPMRQTGVLVEGVTVQGVDSSCVEGHDYGDVLKLPLTVVQSVRGAMRRRYRDILKSITLLARPGEMVLVLGRPGAGCTSLLKTIAGETDQFHSVEGEISYDGISQREMMRRYRAEVVYNSEIDVHFPHLTVKQTLDFALACKTPHVRVNNVSRAEYITLMRELYATVFGLRHTYNTKVGDDYIRGVSGGERKRVSIAEALAANASVYCWDNATRGLDASTALEYAQAMRIMTNLLQSTSLVTLYQASENIYETFDKVLVLFEGRQIYFGDVMNAKAYFECMGYICPARQSTAEFLTALTDINGYHIVKPGYESSVPRLAEEFEQYWLNSKEYRTLVSEIEDYRKEVDARQTRDQLEQFKLKGKSKFTHKRSPFMISFFEQVKLCTIRGFQRIYGDKSFTVINVVSAVVQALITGSLYFASPSSTSGAFSRGGVLYYSILYFSLMGLANINFSNRPILQKHKMYTLYHPSAEALASTISALAFRMIALTLFLIVLYFLSGLTVQAWRFFSIYLFLVLAAEGINAMFEVITALSNSLSQANAVAGLVMFGISIYSTYMIQKPSMHPWFAWISYILPIRYAFENMLNAEFHGRHMDCADTYVPAGPGYEGVAPENRVCAFIGSKPSQSWVLGDDYLSVNYEYDYANQWRNLGILIAFWIGFLTLKCLATEYKRPMKGGGDSLVFKKGSLAKRRIQHDSESRSAAGAAESKMIASTVATEDVFDDLKNDDVFIWRDISFSITHNGDKKKLLDQITGYCIPGTLTALMGESGAGKTTLLNTLAQRNVGIITGDMLVNGLPIDASFERRTGYVQQQDVHVKEMTVRESLQFSARLRRPESVPDAEKLNYVEKIIDILGMSDFADALVGDAGYGLNVEQRKKLSIGVELVAKPSLLLFLDEPTSGLDSQSSWAIVQLLKRLAQSGQSILCTIHQPSATLFEQFDRLLLLKKGGQTVYFGDIGSESRILLDYFERNGARPCAPSENPAEYILEAIGAGATASTTEDWAALWRNSPECARENENVNKLVNDLSAKYMSTTPVPVSKYATSYVYQFRHVIARTCLIFYRDLDYLLSKQFLYLSAGLFIGFTFYDVGTSYTGLRNAMFAVFMSIVTSAPAMNQIQARAIKMKDLYTVRESKSNLFHWSLLLITQYLAELPYQFVFSTIYYVCMFFPMKLGLPARENGVFFVNFCIVFQAYFVGLGLAVLYLSPNLESANVILGVCLSFLISFCGVVQPYYLMPAFWTFMYRLSPYTYFTQNFLGIMLHDRPVRCSSKEFSFLDPPSGSTCGEYMQPFVDAVSGYVDNPDATSHCAYCIYRVGDEYLASIGAKYSYLWRNFGILWGYVAFNLIAMLSLYWLFHVKKLSIKNPFKRD
ncbi:AaceriABR125Cp [[Ashbya] aceris (nom. inval.)]|nr:AaceriABR125Cp [[Ashbya] aceris (nom. inval.)]